MLKGNVLSNRGNRVALVLALFLGLLAAVLTAVYLGQAGEEKAGGGGGGVTVPVVVAGQEIPAGTRIDAGMLSVRPIPKDVVLSGSFAKVEDVVGRVTRDSIVAGEQVVAGRLVGGQTAGETAEAGSLADAVPLEKPPSACRIDRCGQRAMSVSVAQSTASGGLVRAGDRVDVVLGFADGSAVTILEDVEVLALGQDLAQVVTKPDAESEGEQRDVVASGEENADATTVTLAVWPEEAQKLAAGEEFAKGGQLVISDELKAFLQVPSNNISCSGGLRLMVRHTGQQGLTGVAPKGTCATLFTQIWG